MKIHIVSFMCLRARKTKRYGQRVPIVSYYVGSLAASGSNFDFVGVSVRPLRQFRFKNLRRKGGKFDPPPWAAKGPATPLLNGTRLEVGPVTSSLHIE